MLNSGVSIGSNNCRSFKQPNGLRFGNRREVIQKLFQRDACFQMVKQRFDGHAGAGKNGLPAENVEVSGDERLNGYGGE